MKIGVLILGLLTAAVLTAVFTVAALPERIDVRRELTVGGTVSRIFPLLAEVEWPQSGSRRSERTPTVRSRKSRGKGAGDDRGENGVWAGRCTLTRVIPNQQVESTLTFRRWGVFRSAMRLRRAGKNRTTIVWRVWTRRAGPAKVTAFIAGCRIGPMMERQLRRLRRRVE